MTTNRHWCSVCLQPYKTEFGLRQHLGNSQACRQFISCHKDGATTDNNIDSPLNLDLEFEISHPSPPPAAKQPRRSTRQRSLQKEPPPPVMDNSNEVDFDDRLTDYVGELQQRWEQGEGPQGYMRPLYPTHGHPPPTEDVPPTRHLTAHEVAGDIASNSVAVNAPLPALVVLQDTTEEPPHHSSNNSAITKIMGCDITCELGMTYTFPIQKQLQHFSNSFPQSDIALAKLHHKCYKVGAPLYLLDDILKVMQEDFGLGQEYHSQHLRITQRSSLMRRLQKSVGSVPPIAHPVTLESGLSTVIYTFDIHDRLKHHLLSPTFAEYQNLSIPKPADDEKSPFHPDIPQQSCTNQDFTSGLWYRNATKMSKEKIESRKYLLHPFVAYMDKTGVDKIEKNSLEPFAITSAILNQAAREKAENWILLGYVPSLKSLRKKRSRTTTSNSRSMALRDYHHCLSVILEPLKILQKEQPAMLFRRGTHIGRFHIIAPLAAMVGDNLSNDQLAQRVADQTETSPRLSRRCLCPAFLADHSIHKCNPLNWLLVRKLSLGALGPSYGKQEEGTRFAVDESQRQNVIPESPNFEPWKRYLDSQPNSLKNPTLRVKKRRMLICDDVLHRVLGCHSLLNAFFDVDHGPTRNGTFENTSTDAMHTINEGLIPNILEVFYGLMSDSLLRKIDEFVESLFGPHKNRTREKEFYPRVTFRQGYTKLTNLSASERLGQMFVLAIILQTETGQNLLMDRFRPNFDADREKRQFRSKKKNRMVAKNTLDPESDADSDESDNYSSEQEQEQDDDDINSDGCLHWDQIKDYLTNIGLEYIHEDLYPQLPEHHQQLMIDTLVKRIKPAWKVQASPHSESLPDLDYEAMKMESNNSTTPNDVHDDPNDLHDDPLKLISSWQPSPQEVKNAWKPTVGAISMDSETTRRSLCLSLPEFTYLVETILSFHAFLKNPMCLMDFNEYLNKNEESAKNNGQFYSLALSLLLEVLVHGIHRGPGTKEWRIRKIVELSHFLTDLLQFGSADGFNTSTGERNLKPWAKIPSYTAQKRSAIIHSKQTCNRVYDAFLLDMAIQTFPTSQLPKMDSTPSQIDYRLGNGSEKFILNTKTGTFTRLFGHKRQAVISTPLSPTVVEWFKTKFGGENGRLVPIYTQATVCENEICRAHANYRNEGPWYDYVMLELEEEDWPCRLAAIWFDEQQLLDEEQTSSSLGMLKALVQVGTKGDNEECTTWDKRSSLFSHWKMPHKQKEVGSTFYHEAFFREVDLDQIQHRIYCIDLCANLKGDPFQREVEGQDAHLQNCFHFIWTSKEDWPMEFLGSPRFLKQMSHTSRDYGRSQDRLQR